MAVIVSINSSEKKGTVKVPQRDGRLIAAKGLEGDAHGDGSHRQLSLLARESIEKMERESGMTLENGVFAENLTIRGLSLHTLPVGTKLCAGPCLLEVTQIGKECHSDCAIKQKVGKCVMPTEGIFCKILRGGTLKPGQSIWRADALPRVFLLVASDKASAGIRKDGCEKAVREFVGDRCEIIDCQILPDERRAIADCMADVADNYAADFIFTCGGTGFSPRDVTPEATLDIIDREAPGIAEAMRAYSLKITPHAMLSRARAGIRKQTLIVNLPGSPKAACECLEVIMPALSHGCQVLRGAVYECGSENKK